MTYDDMWLKLKNAVFATIIYATLLLITMVITGILSQNFSSKESGRVGVTLAILLISSCFFSRKFEDKKFVRFLKLLLPAAIFYLVWNAAAELTMWAFIDNSWPYWMIIPALIASWLAKILVWILPYLLYRNMAKKEEMSNGIKASIILSLTTVILIVFSINFFRPITEPLDSTENLRRVPLSEIVDKYFPETK